MHLLCFYCIFLCTLSRVKLHLIVYFVLFFYRKNNDQKNIEKCNLHELGNTIEGLKDGITQKIGEFLQKYIKNTRGQLNRAFLPLNTFLLYSMQSFLSAPLLALSFSYCVELFFSSPQYFPFHVLLVCAARSDVPVIESEITGTS